MKNEEKLIKHNRAYTGRILSLDVDDVKCPNGNVSKREIVRHHGGVCILAFIDDTHILMEKQYRYSFNKIITELPAGKLEKDEDPLEAAKRELEEETGYIAKEWMPLGELYPSVGYTDEIIYLYIAKQLSKTERHLDPDENMDIEIITISDALNGIKNNTIVDAKTVIALLKYENFISK